jgi:hypothetical protein
MDKNIVYVLSEVAGSMNEIKVHLKLSGKFEIKEALAESDLGRFREKGLIVFDCTLLTEQHFGFVTRMARAVPQAKILVLASQIPLVSYAKLAQFSNLATLQKPCMPREVSEKLLAMATNNFSQDKGAQNRFPRFQTNQPINVLVLNSGLLIPSRMINYSNGGAFFAYRGLGLKVGDRVQVGFTEESGLKFAGVQKLRSRVVWFHNGGDPENPERGVGVQFLGLDSIP